MANQQSPATEHQLEFIDVASYIAALKTGSVGESHLERGSIRLDSSWGGGGSEYPDENFPADMPSD
ncbi:MAG: hypothetical protein PHP00_13515 [Thiotrichaceae bacterium]|jgi:hypothetical protein|nr:hypothetical protein [Thiotrichaceae bacterium]